jgi:hypothetical protein
MTRIYPAFTILYLFLLALGLGAGIFAGAVTAPVVFHANDYIAGASLSRYEMGSLMSEIFRRLAFIVDATLLVIIADESIKMAKKQKEWFATLMGVLAVIAGYLFYFVPEILSLQKAGEAHTASEAFDALHASSELWFKIYLLALATLFVLKLQALLRKRG